MATCFLCGVTIEEGTEIAFPPREPGGYSPTLCPGCNAFASDPEQPPPDSLRPFLPETAEDALGPTPPADTAATAADESLYRQPRPLPGAILGGCIGGFLGALGWYLLATRVHPHVGYAAVAVGWCVGHGVYLGAGRERAYYLQWLCVPLVLLALAFAQYFIARHQLIIELAARGLISGNAAPIFVDPAATIDIIAAGLKRDPLSIVFWVAGLITAFRVPALRHF